MKFTKQDTIARFLTLKGYQEGPCKSRKYRQFTKPDYHWSYFLGKAGAVRKGKTASSSISVSAFIPYKKIAAIVERSVLSV